MNDVELFNKNNKLVFIQKDDIFTNSKIIAENAGITHHAIQCIIDKYRKDFEYFGKLNFLISNEKNIKQGRPEKIYNLNEQQATFLIALLKNTPKVLVFKKELVRQFFEMREELRRRKAVIPIYIESRKNLTDSIKNLPDSEHKRYKYKHYTDMIYKIVLGMTATQKRQELGINEKQQLSLFLTQKQLQEILILSQEASVLIDMDFTYKQIKSGLKNLYKKINLNKNKEIQLKFPTNKII